jgi:SAM-dependent methyltransferase
MLNLAVPEAATGYWVDGFALKAHLQEFLGITAEQLELDLANGCQALAEFGHRDFHWDDATNFYGREHAGRLYLFDLAAWHLTSQEHIGYTLRLIQDYAHGVMVDFGGGIGTHAITAALCPAVEKVYYCDINPLLREFVQLRAKKLGLTDKLICCDAIPPLPQVDTISCFDVLEHLPNPSAQLHIFHDLLAPDGIMISNWYFFRGFKDEYPFHLDYRQQPHLVEAFFQTLQRSFLEVFHPYFTTTRCYRKVSEGVQG